MIPATGRDVQCSNCSTTWFQPGPRMDEPEAAKEASADRAPTPPTPPAPEPEPERPDPAPEPDVVEAAEPQARPDPEREAEAEPDIEIEPEPEVEPDTDVVEETEADPDPQPEAGPELTETDEESAPEASDSDTDADAKAEAEVEAPPSPQRREVDSAVAGILREEAEREARLRRAEAEPERVETQGEMPLESASRTARSRRLADLEAAEDAFDTGQIEAAVATAAAASRRELLPDIEEINSSLRATGDRREGEEDATDADTVGSGARRRSQSRRGFVIVLLLVAIATLAYVYAADIAEAVPQVAPYLERYIEAINNARFWLDDMARSLAGETAE